MEILQVVRKILYSQTLTHDPPEKFYDRAQSKKDGEKTSK
jgi:hypothetical protein